MVPQLSGPELHMTEPSERPVRWSRIHLIFKGSVPISTGINIYFDPDRSINLFVGIIASQPGRFLSLAKHDAQPTYPTKPGTDKSPYWPTMLAGYNFF